MSPAAGFSSSSASTFIPTRSRPFSAKFDLTSPTYGSYTSSTYRPRDSSLSSSYRTSRWDSFNEGSAPSVARRIRDWSLGNYTNPTTPYNSNRYSSYITSSGLGSETAKYNREEAMKEIQSSFLRDFNENSRAKARFDTSLGEENDYEKLSKGRSSAYLDDYMSKKDALSEMYVSRGKFSNRAYNTISSLNDTAVPAKRKEDYKWRKELEEFEKKSQLQSKARTIVNRTKRQEEEQENSKKYIDSLLNPTSSVKRSTDYNTIEPFRHRSVARGQSVLRDLDSKPASETFTRSKSVFREVPSYENDDFDYNTKRTSWRDKFDPKELENVSVKATSRASVLRDVSNTRTTSDYGSSDATTLTNRKNRISWGDDLTASTASSKPTRISWADEPSYLTSSTKNSWDSPNVGTTTATSTMSSTLPSSLSSSSSTRTRNGTNDYDDDVSTTPKTSWRDRFTEKELSVEPLSSKRSNVSSTENETRSLWRDRLSVEPNSSRKTNYTADDIDSKKNWKMPDYSTSSSLNVNNEFKSNWRDSMKTSDYSTSLSKATTDSKDVEPKPSWRDSLKTSNYSKSWQNSNEANDTNLNKTTPVRQPSLLGEIPSQERKLSSTETITTEEVVTTTTAKKTSSGDDNDETSTKSTKKVKKVTKKLSSSNKKEDNEDTEEKPRKKSVLIKLPDLPEKENVKEISRSSGTKRVSKSSSIKSSTEPKESEESVKKETSSPEKVHKENKKEDDKENQPEEVKKKEKEEEDENYIGTKQIKSDFDARMAAMELEMQSGQSKLAKLRERIRKAKGVIKDADEAVARAMTPGPS